MMNKKILMMSLAAVGFFALSGNEGNAADVVTAGPTEAETAVQKKWWQSRTAEESSTMNAAKRAHPCNEVAYKEWKFWSKKDKLGGLAGDRRYSDPMAHLDALDALEAKLAPQKAACLKDRAVFFAHYCLKESNCRNDVIKIACNLAGKGAKTFPGVENVQAELAQCNAQDSMFKLSDKKKAGRNQAMAYGYDATGTRRDSFKDQDMIGYVAPKPAVPVYVAPSAPRSVTPAASYPTASTQPAAPTRAAPTRAAPTYPVYQGVD